MARLTFILRRGGISLLLTAVAAAAAVAAPGHAPAPQLRLTAASGALGLSNSRAGAAILTAPAMRPGATTTGTATIGASAAARLGLSARIEAETPGAGGQRLSSGLQLVVADVTKPAAPAVVYRGSPARLANAFAGTLAAQQRRTYRFTVTLPASAGDDVQGARLRLSFVWSAIDVTPRPTAMPAPPVPPRPAALPPVAVPSRCAGRGRLVVRLNPPAGTTIRRVDVKVGRGRTKRYKPRRRLAIRAKGRGRVKVTIRLSDGRRISASRAYRGC
jgi:spore coat-associated protein N